MKKEAEYQGKQFTIVSHGLRGKLNSSSYHVSVFVFDKVKFALLEI